MTTLVKIHRKDQMTLPGSSRVHFPNTDNEYTPAQRRIIDAELAEAATGPFRGPFETHDAMIEFLHREVKEKTTNKKTTKRQPR